MWLQLKFRTEKSIAENVSACLHLLDAVAVTFSGADQQEIFEPGVNETPLWQSIEIISLFKPDVDLKPILNFLSQQFGQEHIQNISQETITDQNWENAWLADFHPMQFGEKLWVCPSFATPPDPSAINIILDPGLAFGTGTHPTTALCLQWLAKENMQNKLFIDYGCGSGILAIAAAKLGAKTIYAVDYDVQALEATQDNAVRNGIDLTNFHIMGPTEFQPVNIDIIIANILANPLIELCERFAGYLKNQGKIVLSGIIKGQEQSVLDVYNKYFKMENPIYLDEWVLLQGMKL